MRHGRLVFFLLVVLALTPTAAYGAKPSERFPADGPEMARAMRIAEDFWNRKPCGGHVELRWGALKRGTRAEATWLNPVDAWNRPSRNYDCSITFNSRMGFRWAGLCTTLVHEVGHLLGHRHSHDRHNVMYGRAVPPLRACKRAREALR